MVIKVFTIAKIIFFVYVYFLISLERTDADFVDRKIIPNHRFRATTLDFSNRKTSNEYPMSYLFETTGLIAGGFDLQSVRIRKDGEMDFNVNLKSEVTGGSIEACQALSVMIMNNWEFVYQGNLSDINLNFFIDDRQDLVFFISYDQGNYQGSHCAFDFIFKTWLESIDEKGGFSHQQILHNHISFGSGY